MNPLNTTTLRIVNIAFFLFIITAINAQVVLDQSHDKAATDIENATEKISKLEPKSFTSTTKDYKFIKTNDGRQYGYLVEDVEAVSPQLVTTKLVKEQFGKNAYRNKRIKVVNEKALMALLVSAVKEQQKEIEALKEKLIEVDKSAKL